jgi:arabinose-5-phosphate isomerase
MILDSFRRVLREESEALAASLARLGESHETAVKWILESSGRVITCGLGKSGHIANKTSATLASTGTPSLFLHAAEAVHGDLGMVTSQDIVLLYTYSGETSELVNLIPSLRAIGPRLMVMTGRPQSSAGRLCDLVLDCGVDREACPNNLAPTTSTTLMLALSDALAVAVMEQRGFTSEDFARFHPSGSLGRRLTLRVADVMRKGDDLPLCGPSDPLAEVLAEITRKGAGGACVVSEDMALCGFISDGDVRRHLLHSASPLGAAARDLMTPNPTTIEPDLLAVEALEMFQSFPRQIGEMPVVAEGRVAGLLMLKDLLRSGIV